jgi:hypothetical protein
LRTLSARCSRVTLEEHEAARGRDASTMKMLRLVLDDLNMKLAYDDFGAGQARLNELVEARPDYVKFDRKMISRIDKCGWQPAAIGRNAGQHVPSTGHRYVGRRSRERAWKPTCAARSALS